MNIDKTSWPVGAWTYEPDHVQWIDEATGYPCSVIRHPHIGHLCAYVGVPEGHAAHGKDYCDDDLHDFVSDTEVNEITYAHDSLWEEPTDTQDERATWWLGCDFAHASDIKPRHPDSSFIPASYKTIDHAKQAATDIAAHLSHFTRLWLLRAGAHSFEDTNAFVVRAATEHEARALAAAETADDRVRYGEVTDDSMWLDENATTCEPLSPTGKAEVVLRDFKAG